MKSTQRGFVLEEFLGGTVAKLILVLLIVTAIGGIVYGVKSFLEGVRADGYAAGHKAALLLTAQRDNAELAAANVMIADLNREKAELESAHRDAMQAIDIKHDEEVKRVQANKDRVIADLRSGALRLRDPGRKADTGSAAGGADPAARAAGTPGQCDAPAAGELSGAFSEFLVGLLGEADEVATDLASCQAIVVDDRRRRGDPVKPAARTSNVEVSMPAGGDPGISNGGHHDVTQRKPAAGP